MTERRIIHVDMDYFFVQVETRDNPKLKGKPVIVGGKANHRGIAPTVSYEARAYGVHSAMPIIQARKLCPNGYYVTSRFDTYREVSGQIMKIFRSYTELVEPMSLDEAYLDTTHLVRPDLPTPTITSYIRRDIYEVTRLTTSAGVFYNKLLAKLAGSMNKPNGLAVIDYSNVHGILMQLDIGDFPRVGKASKKKMYRHHIYTGQDLYNKDEFELIHLFGKRGRGLYSKAQGIDRDEVKTSRVRKSVGAERTFSTDVNDDDVILRKIRGLSGKAIERLNEIQKSGKTVAVKIKTYQYETISKQKSLRDPIRTETDIYNIACTLYNDLRDPEIPIRLIGVTVGSLKQSDFRNLTIYDFI